MKTFSFFVHGKPATQGSKRAFWRPGMKHAAIVDDCKRNKPWRSDVIDAAMRELERQKISDFASYSGPVALEITFYMARPASHLGSGKNANVVKPSAPVLPTKKPDLTKLVRPVEDALKGLLWRDDSQVWHGKYEKRFGSPEGAQVKITYLYLTEEKS